MLQTKVQTKPTKVPQQYNYHNISLILTPVTTNRKTGDMIQTWIIRNDINPVTACKTSQDRAICGDCPHRNSSCYVNVGQAPNAIYKSMVKGNYNNKTVETKGRLVRCGAYGDPAFIPIETWSTILEHADNNTGYTHQWKDCDSRYSNFLMASCDSTQEYYAAKRMGYRTFRVRRENEPLLPNEIDCPASVNDKVRCETCLKCNGNRSIGKDISIVVHGSRKNNF